MKPLLLATYKIGLDENVAALAPIYDVAIKPEVFISWIPMEQVGLKPLIFASYIPKPEKASADTLRKVSKSETFSSETFSADTLRKITNSQKTSADLLRNVTYSEAFPADTKRIVYQPDKFSGDTFRRVVQSNISAADTFREVKKTEKAIADTSRTSLKMGTTIVSADLQRNIIVSTKNSADTCRQISESEKISADTYRRIAITDIAQTDSFRKVAVTTVATADTLRKIGVIETFSGDTSRTLGSTVETARADTHRKVTTTEIAIADLNRALREVASYDTFRKVTRKEKAIASTVIRVPHVWNYFIKPALRTSKKLLADNPSLVNTFKSYGVTIIDITLDERTLSDIFTFELAGRSININETVQGYLLDYPFHFLVEETTETDSILTVKGRYSQDDLLYTWFLLNTPPGGVYPKASELISKIAAHLGLVADVRIDDFTPSNLQGGEKITYSDLINSVFSWTSRVPQQQINIFIRGGTLYCLQRGKENSVFDITDLPHSRPIVNKKFNRVLCHNPNKNDSNDGNDEDAYKFNGSIKYEKKGIAPFQSSAYMVYTYKDGLLVNELVSTRTEMFVNSEGEPVILSNYSTTTYGYTSFGGESYLDSKAQNITVKEQNMNTLETNTTEQEIITIYGYSNNSGIEAQSQDEEIYLFHECEQSTKTEYQSDSNDREITAEIRDTYHAPIGNGWYAQTVYLNGVLQGANLSQGKPGNSVSPYTVKQIQASLSHYGIIQNTTANNETANNENDELSAIIDDSLPVRESEIKDALNAALRWLHGKIQEGITVDLISPVNDGVPSINHIVDFIERVKLDGNEYFLVSNHIFFRPRKLIQKLQLIRWY